MSLLCIKIIFDFFMYSININQGMPLTFIITFCFSYEHNQTYCSSPRLAPWCRVLPHVRPRTAWSSARTSLTSCTRSSSHTRAARSCSASPSRTTRSCSRSRRSLICCRSCTGCTTLSLTPCTDTMTSCGQISTSRRSTMNSLSSKTS